MLVQYFFTSHSSTETWYNQEWFIALMSALVGAFAALMAQAAASLLKNHRFKRQVARNLSVEIHKSTLLCKKLIPDVRSTLAAFQRATATNPPSSHPSLISTGTHASTIYYETYPHQLQLLPKALQDRLYLFYEIDIKNLVVGGRIIQELFEKFYLGSATVSAQDIIHRLREYIKNIEELIRTGDELIGALLPICAEHANLVEGREEEHFRNKNRVRSHLNKRAVGEEVRVTDLAKALEIDDVSASLWLAGDRRFTNTGSGKYKRMPRFWKVKKRLNFLCIPFMIRLNSLLGRNPDR